jgi:ribosome biogenesis protein ENP2
MNPLVLQDDDGGDIFGVNTIDINPAHQLLAFGLEGNGTAASLSVTAIASRTDGLSYAVGTSTGHILLYDIRAARPFALKDQGYGLPVKNVCWINGGSRMAGDGLVLSADKKVIKIWDRNSVRDMLSFAITHFF